MIGIISNDCWGNRWYKDNKVQFNTPFIGTFIPPRDFINILQDFDIIYRPLVFVPNKMPVTAILKKNTRIVFLHYKSKEEALEKWNRRLSRMKDVDKLIFKLSIMNDGIYKQYPTIDSKDILDKFHALDFKNKLSFYDYRLVNDYNHQYSFRIPENFAKCALELWEKTYKYRLIKKMFTEKNE